MAAARSPHRSWGSRSGSCLRRSRTRLPRGASAVRSSWRRSLAGCDHRQIELDPDTGTVRVDWHRYAPDQVETWADRVVEAAWRHGFFRVEFVHGAFDVAAR